MTPEEVPAELTAMLDAAAGREHSTAGEVRTVLAAILTRYRELVLAELAPPAVVEWGRWPFPAEGRPC